jgi:hypothetical protein
MRTPRVHAAPLWHPGESTSRRPKAPQNAAKKREENTLTVALARLDGQILARALTHARVVATRRWNEGEGLWPCVTCV